jgi:hypothetical protein
VYVAQMLRVLSNVFSSATLDQILGVPSAHRMHKQYMLVDCTIESSFGYSRCRSHLIPRPKVRAASPASPLYIAGATWVPHLHEGVYAVFLMRLR